MKNNNKNEILRTDWQQEKGTPQASAPGDEQLK